MAEKGGTKILGIVTICIMLVTIGFSGCVGDDDSDKNKKNDDGIIKEKHDCLYDYRVKIWSNSSTYSLIIPLPVYSNEKRQIKISNIINELKIIEGNASFIIDDTIHGPSLRINGSFNTILSISGNSTDYFLVNDDYNELFLSMAKDKDGDNYYDDEYGHLKYWIYCEKNVAVNISIYFGYYHYSGPGTHLESSTNIPGDWDLDNVSMPDQYWEDYFLGIPKKGIDLMEGWNLINGTFIGVIE